MNQDALESALGPVPFGSEPVQYLGQLVRQRRSELHRCASDRVLEPQMVRVQEVAGQKRVSFPIHCITEDRVTDVGQMYPYLMGTSGLQVQFEKCVARYALNHAIPGPRLPASNYDCHMLSLSWMSRNGRINLSIYLGY